MKKPKILITALITIMIFIQVPIGLMDEEQDKPTAPEIECEDKKPDFDELYNNLITSLAEAKKKINKASYSAAFEEAQNAHHTYIQCIFDFAEKKIKKFKPVMMQPDEACLSEEGLKGIIENTSPDQTLPPLLTTYNNYSQHLDSLQALYEVEGIEDLAEDDNAFTQAAKQLKASGEILAGIKRQVALEKENALVAMDMTFAALKELRSAFVMHVHFQCMLRNLNKYNTMLMKLRTVISNIPARLKDASMHK